LRIQDPRSRIRDRKKIRIRDEHPGLYFRRLRAFYLIFGLKILKFFVPDPGSGMENFGSGIRDKHNTTLYGTVFVFNPGGFAG
jgi:hypothetical protein